MGCLFGVVFMSSATVIVPSGGLCWLSLLRWCCLLCCVVLCSACRVVAFEAMLRGDVWAVVCDVWE